MNTNASKIEIHRDQNLFQALQIKKVYDSVNFLIPDEFAQRTDFHEAMYGPGSFGFFAVSDDLLVGAARVLSDQSIATWIAEICVLPDWQGEGIGSRLVSEITKSFPETAIYVSAFRGQEVFFERSEIKPKAKLVALSRAARSSAVSG